MERQLSPRPDVSRDIMNSDIRGLASSETSRMLRDWVIFRDYMNGLEYVVQVFEHLLRGLQSWGWQGGSRRRATRRRLAHLRKPEQFNLDGQLSSWGWRRKWVTGEEPRRALPSRPRGYLLFSVPVRCVSMATIGLSVGHRSASNAASQWNRQIYRIVGTRKCACVSVSSWLAWLWDRESTKIVQESRQ